MDWVSHERAVARSRDCARTIAFVMKMNGRPAAEMHWSTTSRPAVRRKVRRKLQALGARSILVAADLALPRYVEVWSFRGSLIDRPQLWAHRRHLQYLGRAGISTVATYDEQTPLKTAESKSPQRRSISSGRFWRGWRAATRRWSRSGMHRR